MCDTSDVTSDYYSSWICHTGQRFPQQDQKEMMNHTMIDVYISYGPFKNYICSKYCALWGTFLGGICNKSLLKRLLDRVVSIHWRKGLSWLIHSTKNLKNGLIVLFFWKIWYWHISHIVVMRVDSDPQCNNISEHVGLPVPMVCSFMKQFLQGVGFCHTYHVLHRDLKPHNVHFILLPNIYTYTY